MREREREKERERFEKYKKKNPRDYKREETMRQVAYDVNHTANPQF